MSTVVLWIFIPFIMAILLFFFRRWYRTTVVIGTITMALLTISAWRLPINELIRLGPVIFKVEERFNILGRQLILGANDRSLLVLIFGLTAFWFIASYAAHAGRMFVPVSLAMISIWIAALAVEPFLFAALLLELAVLVSIPMLSPPGSKPNGGVIRYLILQTLGMPFILLTGWLLAGVESSPGDSELVVTASTLLGFGFLFLLGIFPFHTWMPMLTEESHPYATGFIFYFQPLMVALFGLSFIDQFAWLRQSSDTYEMLRFGGVLMILIGGAWAALQRHLGRIQGFGAMVSTGLLLLAVGTSPSLDLFFAIQIPRALSMALWALGLSVLKNALTRPQASTSDTAQVTLFPGRASTGLQVLQFRNIYGVGRQLPVAAAAASLGIFSIAGYPIFSSFPIYQALWRDLALLAPTYAVLAIIGSISLGVSGLRSIAVLVMGDEEKPWHTHEHWISASFLIVGIILSILLGLFPQWVLPYTANLSQVFSQLSTQTILP